MAQPNSLFLTAFFLIATTSIANGLLIFNNNINQLQVLGRGLTCSNPSPQLFRPALSGANVTLSCDNGLTTLNSTTTNSAGDFTIVVNNVTANSLFFPLNCVVFVTVPANCTIPGFFGPVRTLRSVGLFPIRIDTSVSGIRALVLLAKLFVAN